MPLSWEESNTKNTIIEEIVKRVINDKAESKKIIFHTVIIQK